MLAWLQRGLFLCWLAACGLLALAVAQAGWTGPRAAVAVTLGAGHAIVLAIEFAVLRMVSRHAGAPVPGAGPLLAAWREEIVYAVLVFFWRQPWRAQAFPDRLGASARGRRVVIFVHGFVCNRGLWNPWLARLTAADQPFIAVDLEPVFGPIDDYVPIIEAAVQRAEQASGLPPLIVAHSMGGLATRAWLRDSGGDARVHGVITLGTPHGGTVIAKLALGSNGRQMRWQGGYVAALAAGEPASRRALFTCYWSECDQIVFPPPTAVLPGAKAVQLPAVAHVALSAHEAVWRDLVARLAN